MGVVQAIKLMHSSATNAEPALPKAQIAVNLTDKILFVGVDGTTDNLIKFVDVGGVGSMMSAYLPKTGGTIGGDLTVEGDLIVNGETVTANVKTITVEDPIITLGGTSIPTVNDAKDRGIEFHWYDGGAKKGFFGFDRSKQKFTFIPEAVNEDEVFSGNVGTILANLEGNASTATKLKTARTIWGRSFDGTNDISGAIEDATTGEFSSNVTIGGTLGVATGTTTLAGGLFDYSQKTITFSYGVGITSGALTISGKSTQKTPYIDFFHYDGTGGYSRIIEEATKELSIYGGASADGKIKLKSNTYAEKALYIGGANGAKLVFVPASGNTPAYLKLANYDDSVMHFVTTGGQTMYSAGVPAEGGGSGGVAVYLNGDLMEEFNSFYAPTSSGSSGQYLISGGENVAPSWTTMPTATPLVAGIMKLGASGGAATYEHGHTYASLSGKPTVVTTTVDGFMSATDKIKLDHLYPVIYNAGAATGKTLASASGSIPAYLYNTRSMLLIFGDGNEQHVYLWIATTNLIEGNKDNPANWLRISKPDVDGGTY